MEITTIDAICLGLVILIGLPHGAFDGPLLMKTKGFNDSYKIKIFSYIAIGIAFWCFWIYYPNFALVIFLIVSLIHFGLGDMRSNFSSNTLNKFERFVITFSHGGLVTIIIPIFHPDKTFFVFRMLGGSSTLLYYFFLIFYILWCFAVITLCILSFKKFTKSFHLYEIIFLMLLFFYLDPLVSFTLYFCGIHTLRHMLSIKNICISKDEFERIIFKALPFIITTFFIVIGLIEFYKFYYNISFNDSLTKTVFILLASLTMPHMIFIDRFLHER